MSVYFTLIFIIFAPRKRNKIMTIDHRPVSDFSAFVIADYKGVVQYPPLKKIESNDWAEEHGLEVELSAPKLEKRTFEVSFLLQQKDKYHDFVQFLTQTTYRLWHFSKIQKAFRLRVIGFSSYNEFLEKLEIKVKVSDDFSFLNDTYAPPNRNIGTESWRIDGVPFSKYGIFVLQESVNIHQEEETKPILEITNRLTNGVKVHTQSLKLKSRKTMIRCFLKANVTDFWNDYTLFLHDLTKPEERILSTERKAYRGCYQSGKVLYFAKKNDTLYCEFEIELMILNSQ